MFDVLILGAGPGGTAAAKHLAAHGKKVALIGKELGGECLNYGCIPTKTYLWTVELLERFKESGNVFGLQTSALTVDWGQMQSRRRDIITKLKKQLAFSLQRTGVTYKEGTGYFVDNKTITVTAADGSKEMLSAPHIIIAVGSSPRNLLGFTWSDRVISNKEILELPELPKSLLVIGGGVVGVEFASLFAGLGVEVTIVESTDRLLPLADNDISLELERIFIRKKITVLKNTRITPNQANQYERILIAAGRNANIDELGLEGIGMQTSPQGLLTDDFCQTSIKNIYAIGDCAGKWMLAYTAEKEGLIAADHLLGNSPTPLANHAVPVTIFSLPEIAFVGMTETQARNDEAVSGGAEKGPHEIIIGKSTYSSNAKALIMAGRDGFAKVIAEKKSKKILGVHMIGERAAELIAEASLAVAHGFTVDDFLRSLHSHPVICEVLKEAMEDVNKAIPRDS